MSATALYGFLASPYLVLLEADFLKKAVDSSESLGQKGWASSVQVFIDRVDIYAPGGGETRCSAVWSAHLFWVQRAIGSNPVTLM